MFANNISNTKRTLCLNGSWQKQLPLRAEKKRKKKRGSYEATVNIDKSYIYRIKS